MKRTFLIKNESGAFLGVADITRDHIAEGITPLAPDDLVDGTKVKDWPMGVHKVSKVVFADSADMPEEEEADSDQA